ncbi:MAG: pitrilysin family protein [Candidatus Neomarinimicrobiota bacterium]
MKLKIQFIAAILIAAALTNLRAIDDSQVREFTLNNGLRVITYEMHNSPVIFSELTYDVGSKHESYGQTGISHAVEHMMFKGTRRFDKGSIAELISVNGGVFNAFTSADRTCYYELLPKNKIELAFDIESERMFKCLFDPEEFTSEMNVIMEERKMRTENSAAGRRREEVNTLLYKSHPYRNPVIGWPEDLKSITREQAYKYYHTYYTPNNATLVLVGDFDTAAMLKLVEKYFGRVPRGPQIEPKKFARVPQDGKKILEFSHPDILRESVQMYFAAPLRFSADGPALYVAGTLLSGRSATSRLYKKLVREEKLCESISGGAGFSKDPGTFQISASLMDGADMAEVERLIWHEIDSLGNYPVIDYDLQKIKNKLAFSELTGDQKPGDVGPRLSMYENYVGWEAINSWSDLIIAVTKEDIMRVIKTYIRPENMVAVYSRPAVKDSLATVSGTVAAVDEEELDETPADSTGMGELAIDFEADVVAKTGLLARLFGKENVRTLYKPSLEDILPANPVGPRIDSLRLNNGVPVYFIEDHNFPTFYLLGALETGRLQENKDQPGLRQFMNAMLGRGTENYTYDEIVEEKSYTPYQLKVSQSWSRITLQGYSLTRDADKMLNMTYETLAYPSFPEEQMEKVRPVMISSAKKVKATETMQAFYAMFEQVFAGHQYALPYGGDPDVLKTITRDDLLAMHDKYFSPANLKLIAVGDFDRAWLAEKLNATLGQWEKPSGDEWLTFDQIHAISGKSVHVFTNPEYKQCRVDIAFNPVEGGLTSANPDREAIAILEHILCGSTLTSRMGIKLRDEQGLCYGIKSNLWVRDHGGYWNIRTNVDKENVARMIQGMLDEIALIQGEGVTDKELLEAKTRKIGLLPLLISTADDIGATVFDAMTENKPLDYFDGRRERLIAVTKEDVQRVARQYLDVNNYIIGVSGDLAEDALDEFK